MSVNLTLRNFEISSCPTLETHEKPSLVHFQLLEQPQTSPIRSRFNPGAVIFATVVSRVNDSIILPNRKRFFQPAQPVYHFLELSFSRIENYKILGQVAL